MSERNIDPINEFEILTQKIQQAKHPEDIFGGLTDVSDKLKAAIGVYRHLSKLTYPDLFLGQPDHPVAEANFKKLSVLWSEAQSKIKRGNYGVIPKENDPIVVKTRRREFYISTSPFESDFTNLYLCSFDEKGKKVPAILKVVRDPADNDLLQNEARILRILKDAPDFPKHYKFFPELLDSFIYRDSTDPTPRQVNVFGKDNYEYFSLSEIKDAYPSGIDPKDMAWIWRRLLFASGYAHQNQIINGAILPTNILIQPDNHGLIINEWSYAVSEPEVSGELISALNSGYESWYPQEVFNKDIPTPALDIYLAAKNMVYLLGGDPVNGRLPATVNSRLRAFFNGCMLSHPWQRPKDAWSLLGEFDDLIGSLWGPRKFHPFSMPETTSKSPFR